MEKTIEIPEGYEARIEGNKVILELKESEDERIRKAIVEFFESQDDNTTYSFIPKKNILAWLEKQGENCLVNFDEAEKEKTEMLQKANIKTDMSGEARQDDFETVMNAVKGFM